MKNLKLYKNGLFVCDFQYDEKSEKTLKKTAIELANVNVNANYELRIEGDLVRTFKNN